MYHHAFHVASFAVALLAAALHGQTYPYQAVDLGPVPGQPTYAGVTCAAISHDGGTLAGTSVWEPYTWRPATGMTALAKPAGFPNGTVEDVNGLGFAVGSCGLPTLAYPTTAAVWDPTGAVQLIGGLGGWLSWATAINDQGTVLGASKLPGDVLTHAFQWTAQGGVVDLTPGSPLNSSANDINGPGQVCLLIGSSSYRLTPGIGLEPLGGVEGLRINEYGQIAGKDLGQGTAGRYTDGIGWEMFAAGSPIQLREIGGINGFGQIVGAQWILQHPSPPSYEKHGYLHTFGLGFQRLDEWIDPAQQVHVTGVVGITDTGAIAAYGSIGPDNRALLLEPRFVHEHGPGCAPAGTRVPRLGITGMPAGGGRMAFLGAGGHTNGIGVFAVALAPAVAPLPSGCNLLVDLTNSVLAVTPTNPIGQATFVAQLPPMQPVRFYAQFATFDGNLGLGSMALSNARYVDIQ